MVLVVSGVDTLDPRLVDPETHPSPSPRIGLSVADYVLPHGFQTPIGAWLLNNTDEDAFRVLALCSPENGLTTMFDRWTAKPSSVPNYAVDPDEEDWEHSLGWASASRLMTERPHAGRLCLSRSSRMYPYD